MWSSVDVEARVDEEARLAKNFISKAQHIKMVKLIASIGKF